VNLLKVDERKDCDLDKIISYLSSVDGDPNKLLDYVKCYIRSFDKERREILLYNTKTSIYSGTDNQPFTDLDRRKLFAQQVAEIIVNKFNKYYSINPRDHTSAPPPDIPEYDCRSE
jgi:hypothetical protein